METVLTYMQNTSIQEIVQWKKISVVVEGQIRLRGSINSRSVWSPTLCKTFKMITLKSIKQHCFRGCCCSGKERNKHTFFPLTWKGEQHTSYDNNADPCWESVCCLVLLHGKVMVSYRTAPLEPTGVRFPVWGHFGGRILAGTGFFFFFTHAPPGPSVWRLNVEQIISQIDEKMLIKDLWWGSAGAQRNLLWLASVPRCSHYSATQNHQRFTRFPG